MKQKKMSQTQIKNLLCQILPHEYVKEDLRLVRRAKSIKGQERLTSAYRNRNLCQAAEIELIKTASDSIVSDYISFKGNLCEKAQVALVERKNVVLIASYVNLGTALCYFALLKLLKSDDRSTYPVMTQILQDRQDQRVFARYASPDFLYSNWNILCTEARVEFIKRIAVQKHDIRLLDKILRNRSVRMEDEVEALLVKYCSDEMLKDYIASHVLGAEAQLVLVKKRNTAISTLYLYYRPFTSAEAMEALIRLPLQNELNRQIIRKDKFEVPEKVQVAILRRGTPYLKSYLVQKCRLSERAELVMLKEEDADFIKQYIREGPLSAKAEMHLVRSKKHDLITYLINRHKLYPASVFYIIKKRNHEEIMQMLKAKNNVTGPLEEMLILRGNKEEIEQYLKNQHPEIVIS